MGKIITNTLPKDLPENWNDSMYVSPNGTEVGLDEKHGYNYLMRQVNNSQRAILELDEGSAPYGYVETSINITSPEELDTHLDSILVSMKRPSVKFVCIGFEAQHPVLGGGSRVFRIDKIWDDYCVVQTLAYRQETQGSAYEFLRSKYAGTWNSWARVYTTLAKPTPADIGAAPDGLVMAAINNILSAEDLDTRLTALFDTMANVTVKYVRANFQVAHPVLGTGDRLLEVFRANGSYGTVRAVGYATSETGSFLEHRRSFYNRVWTSWAKVSGDLVVPATVE